MLRDGGAGIPNLSHPTLCYELLLSILLKYTYRWKVFFYYDTLLPTPINEWKPTKKRAKFHPKKDLYLVTNLVTFSEVNLVLTLLASL